MVLGQVDRIRIVVGRGRECSGCRRLGTRRVGLVTVVMLVVVTILVVMMTTDQVNMAANRMLAWLNNAGSEMRMRQNVPQHEHRNQQ